MKRQSLPLLAGLLLLCLNVQVEASVTFTDGTFNPGDWTATKIVDTTIGNAASFSTAQVAVGGNPGYYASTTVNYYISSAPTSQGIVVAELYKGAIYNPSVQGAISTIDYSYDAMLVSQNWATGAYVEPILVQNGDYYVPVSWGNQPGYNWSQHTAGGLDAAIFGDWYSLASHPDFSSSGSAIQFGYSVSSAGIYQPTASVVLTAGVDNWSITVNSTANSVPEPATLIVWSLLGACGMGFGWKRRKRAV